VENTLSFVRTAFMAERSMYAFLSRRRIAKKPLSVSFYHYRSITERWINFFSAFFGSGRQVVCRPALAGNAGVPSDTAGIRHNIH
jgi:hypothetical protein